MLKKIDSLVFRREPNFLIHPLFSLLNIALLEQRVTFAGESLRFGPEMSQFAWITVSVSMHSGVMDKAVADFVGREGLLRWTPFIQTADTHLCKKQNKKTLSISTSVSRAYF